MRAYLDGRGEPYEVLIVDDGSSDHTVSMSRTIAEGWPQLQVLALEHNTGKGAAVRLGMLSAKGEHRVFSDADLSTPIEEVEQLRARLHGSCAVAIASRALPGSQIDVHQPGKREVMGRTYNRLAAPGCAARPARHSMRIQGIHRGGRGRVLRAPAHAPLWFRRRGAPSGTAARLDRRGGAGALGAQGGLAGERDARFSWQFFTTWCVFGSSSGDNRSVRTAQRATTSGHIDVRVAERTAGRVCVSIWMPAPQISRISPTTWSAS